MEQKRLDSRTRLLLSNDSIAGMVNPMHMEETFTSTSDKQSFESDDQAQRSANQEEQLYDEVKAKPEGIILRLKEKDHILDIKIKIITLPCCSRRTCWFFWTNGLLKLGQMELAMLLELIPIDNTLPMDVLNLFQSILSKAIDGCLVDDLGHTVFERGTFLESVLIAGVLYFREYGQCVHGLMTDKELSRVLFMRLVHRKEVPLLMHFPTRLLLRMGLEDGVYPCSLVSKRYRPPFYKDFSNSISYLYKGVVTTKEGLLPTLSGCHIVLDREKNVVVVSLPRNRQAALLKLLEIYAPDAEGVLGLAVDFAPVADGHMVAVERDDGKIKCRIFGTSEKDEGTLGLSFITVSSSTHSKMLGVSGTVAALVEDGICITTSYSQMDGLLKSFYHRADNVLLCDWSFGVNDVRSPKKLPVKFVWRQKPKGLNRRPVHFDV